MEPTWDKKAFQERLRSLMEGKTIGQFAKQTGVDRSLLRQYLKGMVPGTEKIIQLSQATGVNVAWLANGEGPKDSSSLQHGKEWQ